MATIKIDPKTIKKDHFETQAWEQGHTLIGVDEVGRGCLAGPIVVGAVMLPAGKKSRLLKDSKLLTPEERAKAYDWIIKHAYYAHAVIDHAMIDKHNIYQATLIGMQRAVAQLISQVSQKPSNIVVDAMPLTLSYFEGDIFHFYYGESKSSSIAAASIVAKVTRDNLMHKFATIIPGYQLESHKGYSVPAHKRQVLERGPSIIHRTTFIDHMVEQPIEEENLTLF